MINVLIVDDSCTLRHLIRSILESDPDICVVGEANNGENALIKCKALNPDIVTMDIQMPVMDGYQATMRIMAESPRPVIVLTSTMSERELQTTYKAIECGALMVVGKPKGCSINNSENDKLISNLKALADVKVVRRTTWGRKSKIVSSLKYTLEKDRQSVSIIAIGASTGGPPAIQAILSGLPKDFPIPIVIVQHISQGFVKSMVKWLNQSVPLSVKLAENCENIKPETVYLAPDDLHLLVTPLRKILLQDWPAVDRHKPSVTALMESVACHYKSEGAGVLLTGMGQDGAMGLKYIRDAGGFTIAQDQATSVVFGMPGKALELDAAHQVLPLFNISKSLVKLNVKKFGEYSNG